MDLGNLLGTGLDLYGRYKNIQAGPSPAAYMQNVNDTFGVDPGWSNVDSEIGIPGVEVIRESELDKGMVYKKVCGQYKWVKQKHRRRKKLLTDSDYNGLLKLQTLKNNANMNIAIAKAIGR